MLNIVDSLLDRITMYRLVLYYLIVLLGVAFLLSLFGILTYSPLGILFNAVFLTVVCYIANKTFAYVFEVPANIESVYITALILACIISPFRTIHDLPMLGFAGMLAIASKYILALRKKHIFNPVAIGVALTAIGFGGLASWWVGNAWLTPFIVIGGLLVVRKTRREYMVWTFIAVAIAVVLLFTILNGSSLSTALNQILLHSSFFFFAFVMFTEPLTTPPTLSLQMTYAVLVGVLFPPQVHIGSLYLTPELALVIGNVYSYLVSPKQRLILRLKEKIQLGPDIIDFVFTSTEQLTFTPGQYMEWTLKHPHTDSRGNRRYFTLASSPTE
ncbi:MAG TPA: oxidoreductase, partial [Patescibacteria group bacterium]|nr:oxidoreductase [Patescibacteria group bacterium]